MALVDMQAARRCGARAKQSGRPCLQPALRNGNGRCKFHGGATPPAKKGQDNHLFKHGRFSCESVELRRQANRIIREAHELMREADSEM